MLKRLLTLICFLSLTHLASSQTRLPHSIDYLYPAKRNTKPLLQSSGIIYFKSSEIHWVKLPNNFPTGEDYLYTYQLTPVLKPANLYVIHEVDVCEDEANNKYPCFAIDGCPDGLSVSFQVLAFKPKRNK